ncbi:MAG: ectoine/hydroxyectoine ABC transporter substrate-binding protein EhuB [Alkalibacterium sp.]|nr:ectoine/hydroxyectoine ABC transporter substrate-binding protein EhuB [Alkalibacterium sp.]
MRSKKKKGLLSLLTLSTVFILSGCQLFGADEDETTLERVQREGEVTVGFANEQPYAYQTAEGELTGSAVEVARRIMENLGVTEMNGVLTEFASLIPGLQAERFDMVTAGMFITPGRAGADHVQFANPEYTIGQAIAVEAGNPLDIHSYEDIAETDEATVAVPSGTVEYDFLLDVGVPAERIITVPDMPSALAALQAGRAEVITATGPSLQSILDTAADESIERVEDFTQPIIDGEEVINYGATVFRDTDQNFIDAFNEELENLKESGELLEIIEDFGFTEEDLPGDATVEDAI